MLNQKMLEIKQSGTVEFSDYIRSMELKGHQIYKLQSGDPDFTSFDPIITKAYTKMTQGETHYTTSSGIPSLKKALVEKIILKNKYNVTTENVLVTNGAIHGLFVTLQVLLNPSDEVICIEPCWMPYVSIANCFGAKVKLVSGDYPQSCEESIFENIKNAVNRTTKAIILNSPGNPSGNILSPAFWEKLLTFIDGKGIYLISDEVYEDFNYTQKPLISPASLGISSDYIISLYSFSKSYAMTGWRIGYNVASENLIQLMIKSLQYTITCVPPFIQWAALEALTSNEVKNMRNQMALKFSERATFVAQNLRNVQKPEGAFYSLVNITNLNLNCLDAAKYLVENFNVSLAPGLFFGPNMGQFLRLSFGVSDEVLQAGVLKLQAAGL
jgi:aspartate/methionine/tyrosine aminotransferase